MSCTIRWQQKQQQYQQQMARLEQLRLEEQWARKEEQDRLALARQEEAQLAEKRHQEEIEQLEENYKEECETMKDHQKERAVEARKRDEQRRLVEKLPKYSVNDHLNSYLSRFEEVMRKAELTEDKQTTHLEILLTGKALEVMTQNVPAELRERENITGIEGGFA